MRNMTRVDRIRKYAQAGMLEDIVNETHMMIYANNKHRLIMHFKSPVAKIPAIMPSILQMANTAIVFDRDGTWEIIKDRQYHYPNVHKNVKDVTHMTLDEIGAAIRGCDEETRMFLKLKGFNL